MDQMCTSDAIQCETGNLKKIPVQVVQCFQLMTCCVDTCEWNGKQCQEPHVGHHSLDLLVARLDGGARWGSNMGEQDGGARWGSKKTPMEEHLEHVQC